MVKFRDRCPVTRKQCFDDFTAADARLLEVRKNPHPESNGIPTHVYLCEHCGKWHLTHSNSNSVVRRSRRNERR